MRKRYYDFVAPGHESQRYATEVARVLAKLGRNWEAEAWTALATTLKKDPAANLEAVRGMILQKLKRDPSWLSIDGKPALAMDLSRWPMPTASASRPRPQRGTTVPSIAKSDHLRLSEEADQWGLAGVGAKNNPTDARLAALVRSTGVGGGVIDYDLDGWPDIVVMGAGGTMLLQDSMSNELLRNTGDRFEKVTALAGVVDTNFGQGVVIGDYNEDGFADLFYCSLGKNRLLRNNGDGTFTDSSGQLGDGDLREWTTSGAFVDINADGIADLLTTNYCETIPALDKPCANEDGELGPCHPLKFPAHKDQFFAGSGDGRLIDMSNKWIPESSPARGLGIIAGALDGNQFGVYIANDMSANRFYNHAGDDQSRLVESASARGIAVDGRTLAQASMGIATSDFDGDGDLDFYVTGFGREYNILYEQVAPGMWKDETSRLGLVEPTLTAVGFGTEAVDLDSDGIDEIVVTNGHIGDFNKPDSLPYAQPMQVFRRNATGGFELIDDDAWGEYFATPHVGRALFTIDVNRDGQNDMMVTHMYEQIRLLVNRTEHAHDRIAFKLVATRDSRDAIGAVVRFECGGRNRTLWSLAGDGYMCSNERWLRAGLGQADQVENVTVTWQDGSVEHLGTLKSNGDYLIVQGDGEVFAMDPR